MLRNRRGNHLWRSLGATTVALLCAGCQAVPVVTDSQPAAAAKPPQAAPVPAVNNDLWWADIDGDALVAVWVSPRLPGQVPGGFRFVNISYHEAGPEHSVLLHSQPVRRAVADPLQFRSAAYSVAIRPAEGKTWDEVERRDDLAVDFEVLATPASPPPMPSMPPMPPTDRGTVR